MMMFMAAAILPCMLALPWALLQLGRPQSALNPMSLSMYAASVPALVHGLNNILPWMDKAQAHADARKFDVSQFLSMKLAPDMLPFTRQIQIASDGAKGCVSRLAGVDIPKWEDTETTLSDLRARVGKTLAYLQSFSESQLEGSETRAIAIPMRNGEVLQFTGETFLRQWAMPNFYFHTTTAYLLLRHAGVELGKADFLGRR
jgi:uncharacterized protein